MPFPELSERVVYENNPLVQVICQVRFPTVLRIVRDVPVEFQELISDEFPLFEEVSPVSELLEGLSQQLPKDAEISVPLADKKAYNFSTVDKKWTVSLASGYLALTTSGYSQWEEFYERFCRVLDALLAVYKPKQFARLGLRYQNLIRRNPIGLKDSPWSTLLRTEIAGLLAAKELDEKLIANTTGTTEIHLTSCRGMVRIRHGFATDNESGELCYFIDNDFFCMELEDDEYVRRQAICFNGMAGKLFRWCITQPLYDALGPRRI
jgi:uncharacterized protein (TIGR04255 family)